MSDEGAAEAAVCSCREHGASLLHGVLSTDSYSYAAAANEMDAGSVAAYAGATLITMLPTVHQADAFVRQHIGAHIGQRAIAAAITQQGTPSLLGCQQACAQLAPHSCQQAGDGRWPTLCLHEQAAPGAADALDEALARTVAAVDAVLDGAAGESAALPMAAAAGSGISPILAGVSPTASRLRAWAGVLLAPAAQWEAAIASLGEGLFLERARLLVPESVAGASDARAPSTRSFLDVLRDVMPVWREAGHRDGLVVLLPLPLSSVSAEDSSCGAPGAEDTLPQPSPGFRVDVLLPLQALFTREPLPAVRLTVPPGSALTLSSTARWRLVDDSASCAVMLFEYRAMADAVEATPLRLAELAAARAINRSSMFFRAALALALPPVDRS